MLKISKVIAICVVLVGSCLLSTRTQLLSQTGINPKQEGSIGHSGTLKYATDDFFAAAFLDLKGILTSESYQNLPFDTFIQSVVLFEQFRNSPVQELAVFLKDGSGLDFSGKSEFEVAIALTLDRSLTSKKDLAELSRSITLHPFQSELLIETFKIGDRECYRVPAGSFLNPRRKAGSLTFLDKNGSVKSDGINVGRLEPRRYIDGGNKSQARFTFEQVTETDLQNDKLILNIWLHAFRTRFQRNEFVPGQILLRRPDGKLISDPLTFDATSFTNLSVEFPRQLPASSPTGESKDVDLVDDLIVDGRLEVIVLCLEETSYLGFYPQDVTIDTRASEYVAFNDKTLVVAQSQDTLARMLEQNTESRISQKLKQAGREISIYVDVKNPVEQSSLRHFMDAILLGEINSHIPPAVFSMSGGSAIGESTSAQLEVFLNSRNEARKLKNRLSADLQAAKVLATSAAVHSNQVQNSMSRLRQIGFPYFQLQFPDTNVDQEEFERHLTRTINSLFDNLEIDRTADSLRIRFTEKFRLKSDSRMDQMALAALEAKRSHELFQREFHYLSDLVHKRITDRFPNSNAAWINRAHQNSYNASMEFDSYKTMYHWVRRGVDVLLDGAEHNAPSTDLIWMAAHVIGFKIGHSDQRQAYQELFSNDEGLHDRLEHYIDLSKAKSEDGRIEAWLVAEQMFQFCIDKHDESNSISSVPKIVFYSRPARMRAGYANSLNERGELEQARREWVKAKQMFEEVKKLQLVDAPETDSDSEPKKMFHRFHQVENDIEGWIWRANFEQTPIAMTVRKLRNDARIARQKDDLSKSFAAYKSAMILIAEEVRNNPEEADKTFLAFESIVQAYLALAVDFESSIDDSLRPTIELFEEFQSRISGVMHNGP